MDLGMPQRFSHTLTEIAGTLLVTKLGTMWSCASGWFSAIPPIESPSLPALFRRGERRRSRLEIVAPGFNRGFSRSPPNCEPALAGDRSGRSRPIEICRKILGTRSHSSGERPVPDNSSNRESFSPALFRCRERQRSWRKIVAPGFSRGFFGDSKLRARFSGRQIRQVTSRGIFRRSKCRVVVEALRTPPETIASYDVPSAVRCIERPLLHSTC
jgi:hypothetical protein